jgi:uncharacterized protein YndB with AHSA1/START domain
MKSSLLMNFTVDKANKKIHVEREFAAPLKKVWAAWTQAELLDQWWAPKPWKAQTKSMDFKVGGRWLYAMTGPDGTKQWSFADYKSIDPQHSFSLIDGFCDESGKLNASFPQINWSNTFEENEDSTIVHIELKFDTVEGVEKILETGFQEGFTMGLSNLDELLAK